MHILPVSQEVQFTALSPLLRAGDAAHVIAGLVVSFSQLADPHPVTQMPGVEKAVYEQ